MSWRDSFQHTFFGRLMRGITKLVIAGLIFTLLNNVPLDLSNATIAGSTYDLSVLVDVIKVFAPLALVISALRDFDIEL